MSTPKHESNIHKLEDNSEIMPAYQNSTTENPE